MKRESLKPPPKSKPAEVYGPHLPPGAQIVNGRLVPIPPRARTDAELRALGDPNSRPIDLALLEAEPWTGGGFTWNGQLIRRSRR
jgi:hypothetical protein